MKPLAAYFRSRPELPELDASATAAVCMVPPSSAAKAPALPQPRALDTTLPHVPGDCLERAERAQRMNAGHSHPDHASGRAVSCAYGDASDPGRPGAQRSTAGDLAGTSGSVNAAGVNDGGRSRTSGLHVAMVGDTVGEAARLDSKGGAERPAAASSGALNDGARPPEAGGARAEGSSGLAAAAATLAVGAAAAAASAAASLSSPGCNDNTAPPSVNPALCRTGLLCRTPGAAGASCRMESCGAAIGLGAHASDSDVFCVEPATAVGEVGSGFGDACAIGAGATLGRGTRADGEEQCDKRSKAGARDVARQEGGGASAAAGGAGGGAHAGCGAHAGRSGDAAPVDVGFESVLGWWECGALDAEGAASISRALMHGLARARSR